VKAKKGLIIERGPRGNDEAVIRGVSLERALWVSVINSYLPGPESGDIGAGNDWGGGGRSSREKRIKSRPSFKGPLRKMVYRKTVVPML